MREFFRGLKRKVGCVTLVLAGVLMAGWVRSLTVFDYVVYAHNGAGYGLSSADGKLELTINHHLKSEIPVEITSQPLAARREFEKIKLEMEDRTRAHIAKKLDEAKEKMSPHKLKELEVKLKRALSDTGLQAVIPYWSIVAPLTVISTWLLLSKPRVKEPDSAATGE